VRTVLRAATVIAGAELVPISNGVVIVEDDRIVSVGPDTGATPADLDLGNLTLIPGLIDCHVHLFSDSGPRLGARSGKSRMILQMVSNAQRFLRSGVTTVRDLGCAGTLATELRDAIDGGRLAGPKILAANRAITVTGGHGHQMGIQCDDAVALRRAVRQLVKDGSDWIKVMASGGFVHFRRSEGSAPYFALFTFEEMRIIVDEAHRYGVRVAAHCQNQASIEIAFEAGVDTIEHCTFASKPYAVLDENVVAAIAQRGTFVIPTVNNYWLTVGVPWAPRTVALGNLRRLYELGVRLVAGTDMGIPTTTPELYAEGLRVFAEIGMKYKEILAAATTLAAEAVGLEGETGSITAGLAADLLAVEGNPLTDIDAYFHPRLVMARGRLTQLDAGPLPLSDTPNGS